MFTPENEKIYDTVKRQWAAVSTTVKGKNEKIGEAAYGEGQGSGATKGWALKKQKAAVKISPDPKAISRAYSMKGQGKIKRSRQ